MIHEIFSVQSKQQKILFLFKTFFCNNFTIFIKKISLQGNLLLPLYFLPLVQQKNVQIQNNERTSLFTHFTAFIYTYNKTVKSSCLCIEYIFQIRSDFLCRVVIAYLRKCSMNLKAVFSISLSLLWADIITHILSRSVIRNKSYQHSNMVSKIAYKKFIINHEQTLNHWTIYLRFFF